MIDDPEVASWLEGLCREFYWLVAEEQRIRQAEYPTGLDTVITKRHALFAANELRIITALEELYGALVEMVGTHNRVNTRTLDLCQCAPCKRADSALRLACQR